MQTILDDANLIIKWLITYGPIIGAIVMSATTWFYRWRNIVHQQSLQTVVTAVEACDAGAVKRAVEVAPKSAASETVLNSAIIVAEVATRAAAANSETKP